MSPDLGLWSDEQFTNDIADIQRLLAEVETADKTAANAQIGEIYGGRLTALQREQQNRKLRRDGHGL